MNKKFTDNIKNLQHIMQGGNSRNYRPIVFWSWNYKIEKSEIARQINDMKEYSLGGFVLHARAGLKTQYLSDEWFKLVAYALECAKNCCLDVWIYDEYGWPSGFVGGKLLQEKTNLAAYLTTKTLDYFDDSAYVVYIKNDDRYNIVNADRGKQKYYCIYVNYSNAYVDILNPAVTDSFISLTHEAYYAKCKQSFGNELVGFFTDEPQYYRYATPFSGVVEHAFFNEYGQDVKSGLVWLFNQDKRGYEFRCKYYNLLNKLYNQNFYSKLYDWCNLHNCMLTGHSVEETFHFTQMWGGADCASTYQYQHVPGMDNLTLYSPTDISARLVGSAAMQLGKTRCLTETFGCSGYQATPIQLKAAADKQYVFGVNYMCQHLYNYSNSGQGKIDHPPSFGRALPYIEGYKLFNQYFERLGSLLANSTEQVDCGVISPMQSIYLDYLRDNQDEAQKVDTEFCQTQQQLRASGITYHLLNEKLIATHAHAQIPFKVGKCAYKNIIVANCKNLLDSTAALLKEFASLGGNVFCMGEVPQYVDGKNADLSFLKRSMPTKSNCPFTGEINFDYTLRQVGETEFVFVVNSGSSQVIVNTSQSFSFYNLYDFSYQDAPPSFALCAGESVILVKGNSGIVQNKCSFGMPQESLVATSLDFELSDTTKNILMLDTLTVTLQNGKNMCGNCYAIFELLVKSQYEGSVTVQCEFNYLGGAANTIIAEKQIGDSIYLNGQRINGKTLDLDVGFNQFDMGNHVISGKNIISYVANFTNTKNINDVMFNNSVPESLRNCIAYQTMLEPIYIVGDFVLDSNDSIAPPKSVPVTKNLAQCGYKFFAGKATYITRFVAKSENVLLQCSGSYAMLKLVGDTQKSIISFDGTFRLENLTKGEKYTIKIECYSTLRNVLGSFHCADHESAGVSPDSFTFRGQWSELSCDKFVHEHIVKPFGLFDVKLMY